MTGLSSFSAERAKLVIKFNQLLENSSNHLDECLDFSSNNKASMERIPYCHVHRSIYHLMIKNLHYPKPPILILEMVNGILFLAIRRHPLGFCSTQNSLSPYNYPLFPSCPEPSAPHQLHGVPQRASHFISLMNLAGGLTEANKAGLKLDL